MPFIVDSGPPVDAATLTAARNELPREYGVRVVEQAGRRSVMVRVPRAKPDYNYELAQVAFYATLDDMRDAKDVLLIGDEKTVRMEPLRLRDHIREQAREDKDVLPSLRAQLPRENGWRIVPSPLNANHKGLAIRFPVASVSELDDATLLRARAIMGDEFVGALRECQYVYLISDTDYGRLGRRHFVDAVASDLAGEFEQRENASANPLHLGYQTPGHFIKQ